MSVSWSRRVRARLRASTSRIEGARRIPNLLFVGLVSIGCTSMLGIDGEYVEGVKSAGSGGAGGRVSAHGGSVGDGGAGETGGSSSGGSGSGGLAKGGAGGAGGANAACGASGACGSGEKCCTAATDAGTAKFCIAPEPAVGCSLTNNNCERCPPPPDNAIAVCDVNHLCNIQCIKGYTRNVSQCDPSGTGGAGGQGGLGAGGAPVCSPRTCPGLVPPGQKGCTVFSAFPCCKNDGNCGCTYVAGAYCL
jgi:hypothetical protein